MTMPNTTPDRTEDAVVTQADPEAAAAIYGHLFPWTDYFEGARCDEIRAGNWDMLSIVQAFARHRLTTTIDPSRERAGDADRLMHVIDRDRYAAAACVGAIDGVLRGRAWLREAGRGSYAYDDERYQQEFGLAFDEIQEALRPMRALSKDKTDCTTDPVKVSAARAAGAEKFAALSPEPVEDRPDSGEKSYAAHADRWKAEGESGVVCWWDVPDECGAAIQPIIMDDEQAIAFHAELTAALALQPTDGSVERLREAAVWVNSIPGVRASDQFIAADRRCLEAMVSRALVGGENLRKAAQLAHDALIELNPNNYDHDDVVEANDAAVEAILLLADALGETHGKTQEWWQERRAALSGSDRS